MNGKKIKSFSLKDREIILYELPNGQFFVQAKNNEKDTLNHRTIDLNVALGIFDYWLERVEGN